MSAKANFLGYTIGSQALNKLTPGKLYIIVPTPLFDRLAGLSKQNLDDIYKDKSAVVMCTSWETWRTYKKVGLLYMSENQVITSGKRAETIYIDEFNLKGKLECFLEVLDEPTNPKKHTNDH